MIFPPYNNQQCELVAVIDKKESIDPSEGKFQTMIRDLRHITETQIHLDPNLNRCILLRRAEALRDLSKEFGEPNTDFDIQIMSFDEDNMQQLYNFNAELHAVHRIHGTQYHKKLNLKQHLMRIVLKEEKCESFKQALLNFIPLMVHVSFVRCVYKTTMCLFRIYLLFPL